MKLYLFSYQYNGEIYCFEIRAEDPEDARARVMRLAYATYDGEIVAKQPAKFGVVVWVRNWLSSLGS